MASESMASRISPLSFAEPVRYLSTTAAINSFLASALIFDILPPSVTGIVRQRWYSGSRLYEAMRRPE